MCERQTTKYLEYTKAGWRVKKQSIVNFRVLNAESGFAGEWRRVMCLTELSVSTL
jgi:hypothetical protein